MANLDALARAPEGFVALHRWIFFTGLRLVKLQWPSGEETSEVFAGPQNNTIVTLPDPEFH